MRRQVLLARRAADVDMNGAHVADVPAADQFAGAAEVVRRALLAAGLEDASVAPHRVDYRPRFADRQCQRLLAVNVLAGLGRLDRDDRVPVVGRGDDHRVDVVAGQQLAEVIVDSAIIGRAAALLLAVMVVDSFAGRFAPCRIDFAYGQDLDLAVSQVAFQMSAAHAAHADETERDPVIGRSELIGAQH